MEQQFSLSWKNFHGNLSDGFAGLLDSGEFVDVTLAVDGQLLQAHKVVLSICSPYFKRMFQLNPCQHPIVVLRDVSHRAMRDLIHFMYNGEVSVRQEDLAGFISTAETLEIKGLTNKHSDEEKIKEVPKVPSPVTTLNNNTHITQEVDRESPDHFPSDDLTNQLNQTHNQMDLLNSLRFAARKRKSEEFITNNFNTDIRESNLPEKRTKLREKQILNRHKISNNYPRGNITVKNFDTKPRRESPPNVNMFESIEQANKKMENILIFHEVSNSVTGPETNGRHDNAINDIKKETEQDSDVTFEDSLPKTVITFETPPSPRLEQREEGASNTIVDLPPIARASWPMQGKISSSSLLGAISSIGSGISSPSQHTIITIPQKEDGKKKYPQRSCRFCWRAGKRRDTRFMCQQCSVPLCKTNCFDQHQTEGFLIGWKDESTAVL